MRCGQDEHDGQGQGRRHAEDGQGDDPVHLRQVNGQAHPAADGHGVREAAKAMGKTREVEEDKVRWDCTLCLTTGNWPSRDSCRGRSAPKSVEPLVLPPGLAAKPAATTHPKQHAIPVETDA